MTRPLLRSNDADQVTQEKAKAGTLKRVGMGLLSTGVANTLDLVGRFVLVAVALRTWGEIRYGEWLVLIGLAGFLRIADLGLQSYLTNEMCAAVATSKAAIAQRYLQAGLKVHLATSSLLALGLLILWLFPAASTGRWLPVFEPTARAAFLLLAIEQLVQVPIGLYSGLLRATGHLAHSTAIYSAMQALLLAASIASFAARCTFLELSALRLVIAAAASGALVATARNRVPWISLLPMHGSLLDGLRLIPAAILFLLIPFADLVAVQGAQYFLGVYRGSSEVASLATLKSAAGLGVAVSSFVAATITPEFTVLHASGAHDRLGRLYWLFVKSQLAIVTAASLCTVLLLPLVYPVWTARRLQVDGLVLAVLTGKAIAWGGWCAANTLLLSINRQRVVAAGMLAGGIFTAVSTALVAQRFGVRGAAIASCLGDLAGPCLMALVVAPRVLQEGRLAHMGRLSLIFARISLPACVVAAMAVICLASKPAWLAFAAPAAGIVALASLWLVLDSTERGWTLSLLRLDLFANRRTRSNLP